MPGLFVSLSIVVFLILFGLMVLILYLNYRSNMANNPLSAFHFQVEWGGSQLGFTEVSGLDIQFEPLEYRDGASKDYHVRKVPGMVKYNNIILKRGIVKGDNQFFEWLNTKELNSIEKRDLTISLLNETHQPVVVWRVSNAFPVRYSGPVLRAKGTDVAMEELELAHEGIRVEHIV